MMESLLMIMLVPQVVLQVALLAGPPQVVYLAVNQVGLLAVPLAAHLVVSLVVHQAAL